MNRLEKLSTVRARLVLWTMMINATLVLVLGGVGWIVLRRAQNQVLNDTLQLSAAQLIAAVDVNNGAFIVPPSDAAALTERGVFGWVLNKADEVNAVIGRSVSAQLSEASLDQLTEQQLASGEQVRLLRRSFAEASGSIVVGISTLPLQQTSRNILLALTITMPLVLALSAVGGLFLAGRALKPIATITSQAKRIGRDNLKDRLSLAGPRDEVLELAQTFDEMLDRLQAAFESEQRFTSDASHELRTPLGLLKAQITLALSRPRDAPALTTMVQAMEGYVDRMTRLVETMLALARTGEPLNQHVRVDLAELLGGLTGQMQDAGGSRRIRFTLDTSSALNASVMGDPDRLTQLFMNLLDNAVKYSHDGSSVHISLKPQESGWAIDVADEGVGIAPEHLSHVFERFYRTDVSRARQTGGIGLGLPIAQAIAKQHSGYITVQSRLGSGSVFTVWLPKNE